MAIRAMSAGAANAVSKDCPPKMPAAPAEGGRYQILEAHRKECSMFMTDFWALIKLTFERDDTDQYWSELVRLADSLGRKYYGNRFAYSMRNGEEKMVSSSEFVASMDTSNMIQLTCEVNPKKQGAEEILKRFMELDEMKDAGQMETVQMGEYEFLTVSGVIDGRSAAIGVSTTKDGIVLEFKASYDADENREALLKGFAVLDQEAMKKASESKADETKAEETETVVADQADQPGQPGRSDQTAENQV